MSPAQRRRALCLAVLGAGLAVAMAWLERWQIRFNDYGTEAAPAYGALRQGHVLVFLEALPLYGGSLELRAPAAMAPALWGGNALAVYRFSALPCLLAAAALGAWLGQRLLARGAGLFAATLAVLVCAANPVSVEALVTGHPEELLGGVLCVVSVLAAARGRANLAGLALGLAVANKQWALLAVGPVLVALPRQRVRAIAIAAVAACVLEAPLALLHGGVLSTGEGRAGVVNTGAIFRPQQLWWFIGTPGHWVPAMGSQVLHDFRISPGWLNGAIHPAIVWLAVPLTLLCGRRAGGRERGETGLLLLVFLLLLRCMLDPWDVIYYPLPFILALATWEALYRVRAPFLATGATGAVWLLFHTLPAHLEGTGQALAFLAASVPAAVALGIGLYGRPRRQPDAAAAATLASPRRAAAW